MQETADAGQVHPQHRGCRGDALHSGEGKHEARLLFLPSTRCHALSARWISPPRALLPRHISTHGCVLPTRAIFTSTKDAHPHTQARPGQARDLHGRQQGARRPHGCPRQLSTLGCSPARLSISPSPKYKQDKDSSAVLGFRGVFKSNPVDGVDHHHRTLPPLAWRPGCLKTIFCRHHHNHYHPQGDLIGLSNPPHCQHHDHNHHCRHLNRHPQGISIGLLLLGGILTLITLAMGALARWIYTQI